MIRAVLFDFDGVVVQSENLHMKTFLELLAPYGVSVDEERWYREFAGTGSKYIIATLMKEYSIEGNIDEFVEKRKALYAEHVKKGELKETAGILDFLLLLREKRLKTAIVSGGHRSNIELALSMVKLTGLFEIIVTGEEIKARKPDPAPFLYAAKKLGVRSEECIVIEDSPAGCEAAKKAGMHLVVVRSPASKDLYGFDAIINDFTEFPLEMFI